MGEAQKVRLADIATGFFREDARFKTTIFHVYSSSSDVSRLSELFFAKVTSDLIIDFDHPLTFLVGRFPNLEMMLSHEFQYVGVDKKFVFFSKIDKVSLPDVDLVIFASPAIHDGEVTHRLRASVVMSVYKSLLVGLFGRGFLLDHVASFSIEGDIEHKTSFNTRAFRVPQKIDCRALVDVDVYDDLIARIPLQLEPMKSQLGASCQFFSRALSEFEEYKRFFDYWTALEILVQGKAQKLRVVLAKAYDVTLDFVDQNLKFEEIARLRHELMHHGKFLRLEPEVERRIQGLFLDLMRQRLGLPCKRIMERLET
jgi:hypothetical protein